MSSESTNWSDLLEQWKQSVIANQILRVNPMHVGEWHMRKEREPSTILSQTLPV